MKVLFLHGKESGPHGSKYKALVKAGFAVTSPDLQELDLPDRVRVVESILTREVFDVVVGSSLGGATAILASQSYPVPAMVLCAPAVGFLDNQDLKFPTKCMVLQGKGDAIVPHQDVLNFCLAWDLSLTTVQDDHRLGNHTDTLVAMVREYGPLG